MKKPSMKNFSLLEIYNNKIKNENTVFCMYNKLCM